MMTSVSPADSVHSMPETVSLHVQGATGTPLSDSLSHLPLFFSVSVPAHRPNPRPASSSCPFRHSLACAPTTTPTLALYSRSGSLFPRLLVTRSLSFRRLNIYSPSSHITNPPPFLLSRPSSTLNMDLKDMDSQIPTLPDCWGHRGVSAPKVARGRHFNSDNDLPHQLHRHRPDSRRTAWPASKQLSEMVQRASKAVSVLA